MRDHSETNKTSPFLFWLIAGLVLLPSGVFGATPDQIQFSIQGAWLSRDGFQFESISGPAASIGMTRSLRSLFGSSNTVPAGRYRVLKLTVTGISWDVTFSPGNPSPCPSDPNPSASGSVDLGGNSVFYFKTADLGGNTLQYYRTHPPLSGTGYTGDYNHPFLLGAPIDVYKDSTTSVELVIGVEDALTCDSVLVFNGSNNGNVPPDRFISGSSTGMSKVTGVWGDPAGNELFVSGENPDRISAFPLSGNGNLPPSRFLDGPATRLNRPRGISGFLDPSDPVLGGELFVANYGNDSVTAYNLGIFTNENDPPPLANHPNLEPKRTIGGLYSGIDGPLDVFYDPVLDEIITLNEGSQSVTSHSRTADKNASPRTIISEGFKVDNSNNIIFIDEAGGEGTVKVPIPEGPPGRPTDPFSNGSELALSIEKRLETVLTPGTVILVLFDSNTGLFTFTISSLGSGVTSVEFLWTSPETTAEEFLGFDSGVNSGPLTPGMSISSSSPHLTGFDQPCGIMTITPDPLFPLETEIVVSNRGNNSLVFFQRGAHINNRVFPVRTLKGILTGLDEPCGIRWDSVNNWIVVANQGNSVISFFDPTGISGDPNTPPVKVLSGNLTGLADPAGIDWVNGELFVSGRGGDSFLEVQMQGLSGITTTSSHPQTVYSSPLLGKYNTVLFGVDYNGVNLNGIRIPVVTSERGEIDFDPSGFDPNLNWPRFTSRLINRISRQLIEPECSVLYSEGDKTGIYGTRINRRFYAMFPGINGSFQGSFSEDGSVFSGVMIDHPTRHWIIIGLRNSGGKIPFLTGNGLPGGDPAQYAWGSYFYDIFSIGRPFENDTIRIQLALEMSLTESPGGERVFSGSAGDSNILTVLNPLGLVAAPQSPGPIFRPGVGSVAATGTAYQTFMGGGLEHSGPGLAGSVLGDGSTINLMRNINIQDQGFCDTSIGAEIGFGFGSRQKPAGTFTQSNFRGRYVFAATGDRYDVPGVVFRALSSYQEFWFDGLGTVYTETFANEGGEGKSGTLTLDYRVSPKIVPEFGDFQETVDVMDFYLRKDQGPVASAFIGRDGNLLTFYRSLEIEREGNMTRLLGVGIKTPD